MHPVLDTVVGEGDQPFYWERGSVKAQAGYSSTNGARILDLDPIQSAAMAVDDLEAFPFSGNAWIDAEGGAVLSESEDRLPVAVAIEVRWYHAQGEQFHTKLLAFHTASGTTLVGGSANLTRRNLGDYNLEADLLVRANEDLGAQASDYLERLWSNDNGQFSVPYESCMDDSRVKRGIYRLQEFTGLSSF